MARPTVMFEVVKHDYGQGVVSYTLDLPDRHSGSTMPFCIDTDGSLLIPSRDRAVSLDANSIAALREFLDTYAN